MSVRSERESVSGAVRQSYGFPPVACGNRSPIRSASEVNDVLDGHVGLDVECLDRIYLNGQVPNLQVGGQVVSFLTTHLGYENHHRSDLRRSLESLSTAPIRPSPGSLRQNS